MFTAPWHKPFRGIQLNKTHPLAKSLVGAWIMNERSGDIVFDLSGNGNGGTINGAGWAPSGLDFNGASDGVEIPDSKTLNPSYISISAWIKTSATGVIDQIVSKDKASTGDRVWQFRKADTNVINFIPFSAASNGNEFGTTNIADGVMHHVVGTWDGTTVQVYVDGKKDGVGSSLSGSLRNNPGGSVTIGYLERSPAGYFNGVIDNVLIYNRALSAEEVARLSREPYAMFQQAINPALLYYEAVAGGNAPTGVFYGPLIGPLGGPI